MDKLILSPISLEDLENTITKVIRQELNNNSQPDQTSSSELINSKEAALLFDVSIGTIRNWRKRGIIKGYRIGNRVRFRRTELMAALKSHSKYGRSL